MFAYNLRFPGQYFDVETGKHYNYFRDYDPVIGRYIEADPLGVIESRGGRLGRRAGHFKTKLNHSYGYVNSDPLAAEDPLGLSPSLTWGEILAGGGRGAIGGASRGLGALGLGALIGGAAGAVYGICKSAADSDPCAHCYEDDKRNIAQCEALAATAGRPGTKAYWRAFYACQEKMNKILYKCLQDCESEGK